MIEDKSGESLGVCAATGCPEPNASCASNVTDSLT